MLPTRRTMLAARGNHPQIPGATTASETRLTPSSPTAPKPPTPPRRILITAGPTHEPIDEVRFIGNRSSGRLGTSLAAEAASRGWDVVLLLGPATVQPPAGIGQVHHFLTTDDLRWLLAVQAPRADVIVMAAAVADFRPAGGGKPGKTRRGGPLTLVLEPTPDLLAELGARRRSDQCLIGFALEPAPTMVENAADKLRRKKADFIMANPLETMDSPAIEGVLIGADGIHEQTPGKMDKPEFARWLMDRIEAWFRPRSERP